MDINREALNRLAPHMNETFTVKFVSEMGVERTITDHALGILGYLLPSDKIVSIERA